MGENKVFIPESFDSNISNQLFDYTLTLENSQHYIEDQFKRLFCTQKPVLRVYFKDF